MSVSVLRPAWHRSRAVLWSSPRRVARLIVVVGVLATLGLSYAAATAPGVYLSRAQVRFIAPKSTANPNGLQITPSSMVLVAGAVRRAVSDSDGPRTVSIDLTLADKGIREGESVTLPNTGGQWASNFVNPYLDLQVVGPTAQYVSNGMRALIGKVSHALASLNQRANVDPHNAVRLQLSPLSGAPIYYQHGSAIRAALGCLVLGLGLTIAARAFALRLLTRARSAERPRRSAAARTY